MINKFKKNVHAILDIGSSKIVCLIAEIENSALINILGIGHHSAQGFKNTVITDMRLAENSIIAAVNEAETMAAISIEKVTLVVSGPSIETENIQVETEIDEQVTDKNVKDILNKALSSFDDTYREIIHFFPLDFGLDNNYGIKNPATMYGYKLQLRAKIMYLAVSHVMNLVNCLGKCKLNISSIAVNSYTMSFACLNDEEKEQGITLVDIGANNTSIIVFCQNQIIDYGNLPVGGNSITSDISYGLTVDYATAERLKIIKGNAFLTSLDNGDIVEIENQNSEDAKSYVPISELSNIIRARLEEILEIIRDKISELSTSGLASKKIAFTGGTCNLTGFKEIASSILEHPIRIAAPKISDKFNRINKPEFSTAVGALYMISNGHHNNSARQKPSFRISNNISNKIIQWFKNNL